MNPLCRDRVKADIGLKSFYDQAAIISRGDGSFLGRRFRAGGGTGAIWAGNYFRTGGGCGAGIQSGWADGLFSSKRGGDERHHPCVASPGGGGNLWRVDRVGAGWGEPRRLPDLINSDSAVFSPAVTADGSLYFMKPVGDTGRFHLYRSAYQNGGYQAPVAVPFSAADSVSDVDAAVAADESFIVFSSRRAPAKTLELFIVLQKNGIWGEPRPLGANVNRGLNSIESRLSPDGRRLYFSSVWAPKPVGFGEAGSGKRALERSEWETGLLNIWSVPLVGWTK